MPALIGTWLLSVWGKIGGTILKWLSIALGILGLVLYWRHLIIASERGEQASKALEASNERKVLDRKIDAMPDSGVRDLLRAQQSRFKRQL